MAKYVLNTTVEILGAMWTVKTATEEEEPRLRDTDGFTDWTTRLICVSDVPDNCDCNLDDPLEYVKKVIRHEIVHAFMFESGLAESWEHQELGQEEMTVDWIAIQLPKISRAVKQVCFEIREAKGQDVPETEKPEDRPVKEWIRIALAITTSGSEEQLQCPNCGFTHEFIDGHTTQYNYCPQCGTELRGITSAKDVKISVGNDMVYHRCEKPLIEMEELVKKLEENVKKDGYHQ